MSARKLGRFAGLVFVLAALVGGVSTAAASVEPRPGVVAATDTGTADTRNGEVIWD